MGYLSGFQAEKRDIEKYVKRLFVDKSFIHIALSVASLSGYLTTSPFYT